MTGGKKHTVRTLRKMKTNGEKIVMLSAYDAPTAKFAQAGGVDMILVGDSLGMAALGYSEYHAGNQLFDVALKLRYLVAGLILFSALMQFIGLAFIYNLDKKTLEKMTEELSAKHNAE